MTQSYRSIALVVACALFMEMVDATVLSTALPSIGADLGVSPVSLSLAITAYVLSLALFIPLSGWLADRYGAKQVFVCAIGVFLAGSLACASSDSLGELVAARALQGLGGALMTPVARLILLRAVPRDRLVDAMAWMGVPALVGPLVGPPLGGFLIDVANWRWIFWINLPIGIIGLIAVWRIVPSVPPGPRRRLDVGGFATLGLGLLLLMAGLELLDGRFVAPLAALGLLATGVALLVVYVRHALRRAEPAIDVKLMRLATFRASLLGGLLFRTAVGAMPLLLPLSLQSVYGYSPTASGLVTCTAAFGAIMMKAIAGRVIGRYGFRQVLVANALVTALLFAAVGLVDPSGLGLWLLIGLLVLGGFSRSLQFTAINTIGFADVQENRMGDATAFTSVAGQVAFALGVAVAALLLSVLPPDGGAPSETDFEMSFLIFGLVMALATPFFWRLTHDAGAHMSRGRTAERPLAAGRTAR